jgi:hypothetical protein
MLQSINHLHDFTIHAEDGAIGTIEDLYLDDAHWTIRSLVVDTGKWLPGRRVLMPANIEESDPRRAKIIDVERF